MVPAFGMVIIPHNRSNGKVPCCSCILSAVEMDVLAEEVPTVLLNNIVVSLHLIEYLKVTSGDFR